MCKNICSSPLQRYAARSAMGSHRELLLLNRKRQCSGSDNGFDVGMKTLPELLLNDFSELYLNR